MLTIKDIVYSEPIYAGQGGVYYQNVILKNDRETIIGCLISRETSILNPIQEIYQVGVPDTRENREYPHMESEEEGWIFLQFSNINDFIDYYNKE